MGSDELITNEKLPKRKYIKNRNEDNINLTLDNIEKK